MLSFRVFEKRPGLRPPSRDHESRQPSLTETLLPFLVFTTTPPVVNQQAGSVHWRHDPVSICGCHRRVNG